MCEVEVQTIRVMGTMIMRVSGSWLGIAFPFSTNKYLSEDFAFGYGLDTSTSLPFFKYVTENPRAYLMLVSVLPDIGDGCSTSCLRLQEKRTRTIINRYTNLILIKALLVIR
jgi:hypothetical protein